VQRLQLITYRGMRLTQDTADGLRNLEHTARTNGGWRVEYGNLAVLENDQTMLSAGREVHMRVTHPEADETRELVATWAFAQPAGFTPWDRYPVASDTDRVFHFMGPWRVLFDRLSAEGRGHFAWLSVNAAAISDVGMWRVKKAEHFLQAQLHRIGLHCGLVDGIIGPRTIQCLETLGMQGMDFDDIASDLGQREPRKVAVAAEGKGHVSLPGFNISVSTFGGIDGVQTSDSTASLRVNGPGRVIIDVRGKP
jgi:hypothetical protein